MMFWMAYGAGLVRQRSRGMRGCNKASNRICRQSGRCFLINLVIASVRLSRLAEKPYMNIPPAGIFASSLVTAFMI
jgi:hypothetical protein